MDYIINNSIAGKNFSIKLEKKNKSNLESLKKIEKELKDKELNILKQKNVLSKDEYEKKVIDLKKEVIVVPDADSAGMDLVKTAIRRGWSVSFPPWEGCKDTADAAVKYGRLFTVRSIIDSAETNTTKIQLLAKSYCR